MSDIKQAVIMAGGRGTRVASVAPDVPKPMIKVCGRSVLERQIDSLREGGIKNIILVVGYMGAKIKECFGDGGAFGVNISYYEEDEPLGTAGALYKIKGRLEDDFILLCADIVFDIDWERMIEFYKSNESYAALAVHPNSHPFDSALLVTNGQDRVVRWITKDEPRLWYKNQVNAGLHIINKKLLDIIKPEKEKLDLDRDLLKPALSTSRVFAYRTPEYIKDMGTPERLKEVSLALERGLVQSRNLLRKQKAVFLDRDGTINESSGFVRNAEDFVLIEGAAEAVRKINDSGYLAIVITNQPVIARGEVTLEELELIHNKMEAELGARGAYLDDIFFCPHHPERGFEGERAEYKIDCDCRKPKPGMILAAARKYNIDLTKSFMIGDSWRDVGAARNAGCTPLFISDEPYFDAKTGAALCKNYASLLEAVFSGILPA